MKLYIIPGLGFDHRMFNHLDFSEFQTTFLDWIEPIKNENISDYALRLAKDINENSHEKTVIIGHSLGGVMASEIARIKKVDQIILISSIRSSEENPFQFRIIKPLGIHHLFTKKFTFSTFKYWAKQSDYVSQEEQDLFRKMVGGYSDDYLKWALKTLSIWKSHPLPSHTKVFQIHGDKDKNFPIKKLKHPDRIIQNAGHFMAYKRADEIGKIIMEILNKN